MTIQEKIDALEKALAEGVSRVKYTDKEIQFRSYDDMIRELRRLKKEAGSIPADAGRLKASFSSGTGC